MTCFCPGPSLLEYVNLRDSFSSLLQFPQWYSKVLIDCWTLYAFKVWGYYPTSSGTLCQLHLWTYHSKWKSSDCSPLSLKSLLPGNVSNPPNFFISSSKWLYRIDLMIVSARILISNSNFVINLESSEESIIFSSVRNLKYGSSI
jgi:hypothetical protein